MDSLKGGNQRPGTGYSCANSRKKRTSCIRRPKNVGEAGRELSECEKEKDDKVGAESPRQALAHRREKDGFGVIVRSIKATRDAGIIVR